MANQSIIYSDVYVSGTLAATRFSPPSGSIANAAIAAGSAANYVAASKLEHQFAVSLNYADTTSIVNGGTRMMHIVRGATGEVVGLEAVTITAASATSVGIDIDLRKVTAASTGTSILTGVLTFYSTDAVRTPRAATISSADLADGDQLHLVVTTTGSTASQAAGLLVTLTLREDPA